MLVTLGPPDRPEEQSVQQGPVQNGVFEFAMRQAAESGWQATAYYTGGFDTAPCESETVIAP